MAIVLSIINNKGGTGKTTTTLNLAAALAKKRKKVLVIDIDSQCNLTSACGLEFNGKHLGNLLLNEYKIEEIVSTSDRLSVVPSSSNLLDFEYQINNEPGREYILKEAIDEVKDRYDYILFDCPPSMGTLALNSLVAAHYFVVPMQAENFAFIGLDKILQTAEKIKKRMNPDLELGGILFVRHSSRTKFSQAVISNISNNEHLQGKLFKTTIRQDINLMESAAFHQDIFEYAPKSRGAEDYLNLAKEIIKTYGKR